MATIASLAVKLMANPEGFVTGLSVATKAAQKFGRSGFNPGTWAKLANNGFASINNAINSVVGPIKQLIGSIPLVGGALASLPTSLSQVTAWFQEGSASINEMRVNALKLGIPIERMAGLMMFGGESADALVHSMFRLQEELGQAASMAIGTEVKFSRLGLNARELAAIPLDTSFGKIADKMNALDNASAKAMAIFSVFGKGGIEMASKLSRGSAGLAEFQQMAERMGRSVSKVDAENVLKATMAVKKLDMWMNAAKQSIAVELSPVVIALAEQFGEVGIGAKQVGEWAMAGVKMLAYGGAAVVETWTGLKMIWSLSKISFKAMVFAVGQGVAVTIDLYADIFDTIQTGMNATIRFIADKIKWLMQQAGKLPDALGGAKFRQAAEAMGGELELSLGGDKMRAVAAGMKETARGIGDEIKHDFQAFARDIAQPGAFQKVDQFFAGIQAKAAAARRKNAKDADKAAADAKARAGAERMFAFFERGQKLNVDLASPVVKFQREVAQLNELVEAGAVTWETYSKAVANAANAIQGAEFKQSSAMDFGSQEAFKAISSAQYTEADPLKRVEAAIKLQTEIAKRTATANEELARLARKGFVGKGSL